MPAAFAFGHSLNHHRYNNGPLDVVSTADKPRDSFINFITYLTRWFLYSLNISTFLQFISEKKYSIALKIFCGSLYWWSWFALFSLYLNHFIFAIGYILYPFAENVLLLAAINWAWHAFINPNHHDDEYVGSLTIFKSPLNVLNENYHVIHHQYPNLHWSLSPYKLLKHYKDYVGSGKASMFTKTHPFELFFYIILKDYQSLVNHFIEFKTEKQAIHCFKAEQSSEYEAEYEAECQSKEYQDSMIKNEEIVNLLKARLRECSWGPRYQNNRRTSLRRSKHQIEEGRREDEEEEEERERVDDEELGVEESIDHHLKKWV
mmetsp:Transcript_41562/g.53617  ORF Transcript_41562/g.53617 Transcript_41562/m.53617 type:complete len:318 (-) Transcript_41562:107-1060(-)